MPLRLPSFKYGFGTEFVGRVGGDLLVRDIWGLV